MSEWQTVETAPNGPRILLWDGNEISIGVRQSETSFTKVHANWPNADVEPTHWMPQPNPPLAVTGEKA